MNTLGFNTVEMMLNERGQPEAPEHAVAKSRTQCSASVKQVRVTNPNLKGLGYAG